MTHDPFLDDEDDFVYGASTIKRRTVKRRASKRATKAEMEERARFLIGYSRAHGPVTARGLYYQAEVAHVTGIDKNDLGYRKVQQQVLKLRRAGRISYHDIADATRWMRKPTTYNGPEAVAAISAPDVLPDAVPVERVMSLEEVAFRASCGISARQQAHPSHTRPRHSRECQTTASSIRLPRIMTYR